MERLFRSLDRSIMAGPEEQKAFEREVVEAAIRINVAFRAQNAPTEDAKGESALAATEIDLSISGIDIKALRVGY